MSGKSDNPKTVPKKIPIIPPLLVEIELVSDFIQKANIPTTILSLNVLLLK